MRVTFVLPAYPGRASGGYKVVYQYANHLARRGYSITVVHPRRAAGNDRGKIVRGWLRYLRYRGHRGVTWFDLDSSVRFAVVASLDVEHLPAGNAIFATAWDTAEAVSKCGPEHGFKLYLIQSYETWDAPQARVDATWRLPLHKVVNAPWLLEIARRLGEESRTTYISNGLDFGEFRVTNPIEQRLPRVGMHFSTRPVKGAQVGIAALEAIRAEVPDVSAVLFGQGGRRHRSIPTWVDYVASPHGPALMQLYNEMTIFLHTSREEGWGLPPAEAMACGCALVAVANEGVRSYALDGETALLAPIGDVDALAGNVTRMLRDDELRQRLARAGNEHIQLFSFERAATRMDELLRSLPS